MVSDSMRDNPLMQYYAAVYTMSMVIMLLLKVLRGIIFVKVSSFEAGLNYSNFDTVFFFKPSMHRHVCSELHALVLPSLITCIQG